MSNAFGRNDGLKPFVTDGLNKGIGIIAFVCQKGISTFGRRCQQVLGLTDIDREKRLKTESHLPNKAVTNTNAHCFARFITPRSENDDTFRWAQHKLDHHDAEVRKIFPMGDRNYV